jgi:hypothetical protein
VHHIDPKMDDPALREVLSQRPEGLARGRQYWGGYLENLDRTEMGKSCKSPIAAPRPQQKDQLRPFLEAYENIDKEVVQESAVGSTKIDFIKEAVMEGSVDQPVLDESENNMQMDVNDTIDPRLLEAHPSTSSTSYPYFGQDGPSPIITRTQDVFPDIQYDNAAEDTEMSEAEIAEPSRVRNLSYLQTSLSSTPKGQYHCSHCPQVFPTRGKRKRHER